MPEETLASLIDSARSADRAGAWDQALTCYEAALRRIPQEGTAGDVAKVLRWIGTVHRERGELDAGEELYQASRLVAELSGLSAHVASAVNYLAHIEQLRGDIHAAERLYMQARRLAQEAGDDRLAAMVLQNLGMVADIRGDTGTALVRYRSALERFRRLGDDATALRTLNNMGMAHVDLGEWEEAEACFDSAFELADRLRDTAMLGLVEVNRAALHLERKEFERARECCDRGFEIFGRLESKPRLSEAHKFYGMLYRETGKSHLAQSHLAQAVELARDCGDRLLEAEAEGERALAHLALERNRDALACLNRAHALFAELGARREIIDIDRRLDRLEGTYLAVVQAWGESIESKDHYTVGHCQRVADYGCMLAEAVGIAGRDLTWFRMGAFLHDVGKTAVPAEVLNKPGRLTAEEWELMKAHTTVGDEIVAELNFPWDIRPIVRNHHERWDGGGYPDGLAGEAIPLTARILGVADVYDALTTARSYRPALPEEEALRIMERDSGRQLDPRLFERFRALLKESPRTPVPA